MFTMEWSSVNAPLCYSRGYCASLPLNFQCVLCVKLCSVSSHCCLSSGGHCKCSVIHWSECLTSYCISCLAASCHVTFSRCHIRCTLLTSLCIAHRQKQNTQKHEVCARLVVLYMPYSTCNASEMCIFFRQCVTDRSCSLMCCDSDIAA
uniref:Uncharacterized protein n=1 Tax=Lygus hesperus TaxID=30085 RepID=A0A146KW40_LYGHE